MNVSLREWRFQISSNNQSKLFYDLEIIGGVGPLASAKFVYDLCQKRNNRPDQEHFNINHISWSKLPKRSEALLNNEADKLLSLLKDLINSSYIKSKRILILCFTMHNLIDQLDIEYKNKVIDMRRILLREVQESKERVVIMCTNGSRVENVFRDLVDLENVNYLPSKFQEKMHKIIYKIKQGAGNNDLQKVIHEINDSLDYPNLFFGCTELYLLYDQVRKTFKNQVFCPVTSLSNNLEKYLGE